MPPSSLRGAATEGVAELEELVRYVSRALVDEPDDVRVATVEDDRAVVIELTVAEDDLGKVIGKEGRHIPKESALDHVFGYTIVNDVTARDRQVRRTPEGFTWYELGRGKVFETSAPTGPWIVTADEIGNPQNLRLKTRVNGELRQSSNTSNMIWSCADLIHFFSWSMMLRPGMMIITGTPSGTAWSTDRELGGKWLGGKGPDGEALIPAKGYNMPGDIIECELEKIGVLRNSIA